MLVSHDSLEGYLPRSLRVSVCEFRLLRLIIRRVQLDHAWQWQRRK
jgi:hypothetical protein